MIDVARGDHHLRIVADLPLVHYVRDLRGARPRQLSLIRHVTAELEGLRRLGQDLLVRLLQELLFSYEVGHVLLLAVLLRGRVERMRLERLQVVAVVEVW